MNRKEKKLKILKTLKKVLNQNHFLKIQLFWWFGGFLVLLAFFFYLQFSLQKHKHIVTIAAYGTV